MKALKVAGLVQPVGELIQRLRLEELKSGAVFRSLWTLAVVVAFCPMMISPFIAFAFALNYMPPARVYASLSYLLLVATPLSKIYQGVPSLAAALACLDRIQTFLRTKRLEDFREVVNGSPNDDGDPRAADSRIEAAPAITVDDGFFGWDEANPVLRNINVAIPRCELTIVMGPVASGKSTLCNGLLGETPFSSGTVTLRVGSPLIGYCGQSSFLWHGTIKDNILGGSSFNATKYSEVTKATMLHVDFARMPLGDETPIESNGA